MQNTIKRIALISLPVALGILLLLKFKAVTTFTASKFDALIRLQIAGPLAIFAIIAILLLLVGRVLVTAGKIKWPLLPKWMGDEKSEINTSFILPWKLFAVAFIFILLYFAPYLIKGVDTHVKIFDVLDAWLPQGKILAESGNAFSLNPSDTIDNLANGLRISGYGNGYNVTTWLFMIFSPFTAYVLNLMIMAAIAFWGMALLLKRFILHSEHHTPVIIGSALCFSLLIFYPPAGLSISGLPLLLYFFMKIRTNESKPLDFLFIALFPFYSLLHHAGIFIIAVLGVIFLADLVKRKPFNTRYLLGLVLLGVLYFFTHFHLLYSTIDPEFVSFRKEIVIQGLPFGVCLKGMAHNFTLDRVNAISGQQTFILLSAALALLTGFFSGWNRRIRQLVVFVLLALLNAFLWGFKYWDLLSPIREKFPILNEFNLARFFWLTPVIWGIVFAVSLTIISKVKFGKIIAPLLILGQLGFLFIAYNPEYRHVLGLRNKIYSTLTYRQFYSEKLFDDIDRYIGKPKSDYRTASLGIHPAIAQYNGFYTLDLYSTMYSLDYKHKFRKIIAKEIEKSERVKQKFDENGKRCFILSAELHGKKGRTDLFARGLVKWDKPFKIKNLEIDTAAFKELGGQYIFSAVEILNAQAINLNLEKIFEHNDSSWLVYLYKVI